VTCWIFNISKSTFDRWRWIIVNGLYNYYIERLQLPNFNSRKEMAVPFYRYQISMIIDGVEQEIEMKVNKKIAKLARSGKKAKYTVTKLIGVSPLGKLMIFSRSYRGALNDMNLCHQLFTKSFISSFTKEESIAADKGFIGLEEVWSNVNIVTPFKKKNGNIHEMKKVWNNRLKTIRTVVENYFSQLKDFKILRYKFRANGTIEEVVEKHHYIWTVCAGILDQFVFPNGVRL